jgi:RimJ/RimL family protein N-acetyltransferase
MPIPWPLTGLTLSTPRLDLRPDDDAGLLELIEESYNGIHPPDFMPFKDPWTDAPREILGRSTFQRHWAQRAALSEKDWAINFLVRVDGHVIGTQTLAATEFTVSREVTTRSWLGQRFQGLGYGKEMRAAVLMFAFDYLGARQARSGANVNNHASIGVSRKLGYVDDGTVTRVIRGQLSESLRLKLNPALFAARRPDWNLNVSGAQDVLPILGAEAILDFPRQEASLA